MSGRWLVALIHHSTESDTTKEYFIGLVVWSTKNVVKLSIIAFNKHMFSALLDRTENTHNPLAFISKLDSMIDVMSTIKAGNSSHAIHMH